MTTPRGGGGALILVWTISKGLRSGTCFYSVVIIIQWTPYIPIEASIHLSHLTFSQSYTCSTTAKLLTHFLRIASQIKNGNRPKTSPISITFCKTSSSYFPLSPLLVLVTPLVPMHQYQAISAIVITPSNTRLFTQFIPYNQAL